MKINQTVLSVHRSSVNSMKNIEEMSSRQEGTLPGTSMQDPYGIDALLYESKDRSQSSGRQLNNVPKNTNQRNLLNAESLKSAKHFDDKSSGQNRNHATSATLLTKMNGETVEG